MHSLGALLFLASALVVKQDKAPLRSGCEARDSVVASLPAGAPIEIRFAMSGSSETCYKAPPKADGKDFPGYLPASALTGLEEFEAGLRNAPGIGVSEQMQKSVDSMQAAQVSGPPNHPLVRASAALNNKQPQLALDI